MRLGLIRPVALAGILVLGLAACSNGSSGASNDNQPVTLTYVSYGGALQKGEEAQWLNPYQKAHPNVTILYDAGDDNSKLITQVESGNVTWDVVIVGSDFGLASTEKYLTKIDCTIVPCSELQPDKYPTTGYRAAQTSAGTVMGWNKNKVPAGSKPQNWADFFDLQKFPGKRVMMGDLESSPLEVALVADGVDPSKLYPLDVSRALKKLDTIKKVTTFTTNYQGCAEKVATGDVVMGQCWSGRFYNAIQNNAAVEYTWYGQTASAGYYVVPKGSKNVKEAMKLIAYIVSADHDAALTDTIPYGPANAKALAHVKDSVKPNLGTTYLDTAHNPIYIDDRFYDQNRKSVQAQWQTWLTS